MSFVSTLKKGVPVVLPALLSVACGSKQDALLDARFKGVDSANVYISASPLAMADSVLYDTVRMTGGRFCWNSSLTSPTEVHVVVDKDVRVRNGRASVPASHQVVFLAMPGEKIRLDARYEDGFLAYDLTGSGDLQTQSGLRNAAKSLYVKSQILADQIAEELEEGYENADEKYLDSLYALRAGLSQSIRQASLSYVQDNPDNLMSAFFLLQNPEPDTFLAYYDKLDASVRDGILKERLDKMKAASEHRLLLRANDAKLVPGSVAPAFSLTGLDGKAVSLADYTDKYVVLDFWGTWCPWCVKGIPQMKEYYAKHKGKVVFISIACRDKVEKVRAMVEKEGIAWINVMNGTAENDVALSYGVSGFPTKVLLEPGLRVKAKYLGEVPEFYRDLDAL